jgi:hypothetical protein
MQCASDWMTLGPAIKKNGAAACSSRNRSEYWRPRAGSLCVSSACAGGDEKCSGASRIHSNPRRAACNYRSARDDDECCLSCGAAAVCEAHACSNGVAADHRTAATHIAPVNRAVQRGWRTGGVIAEAGAKSSPGCRSAVGGVTAWSVIATSCGLGAMLCSAPEATLVSAATALPPASAAAAANCRSWFRRESCA